MGLFDIVRDKAAELFSGASEKVSELTGVDLPGTENADNLADAAADTGQEATDAAQGLGDTATDAVQDLPGTAADAANDAIADVTDPPRPE